MRAMADVIFIALVVVFFVVALLVVGVCDRISRAAGVDERIDELLPVSDEPTSHDR